MYLCSILDIVFLVLKNLPSQLVYLHPVVYLEIIYKTNKNLNYVTMERYLLWCNE